MSSEKTKRSGRRPGPTTTRDAIAAAARRQFAELGYDRATIRGIAGEAGVDGALVLGRIRSASSHPDAAALVRETVTRDVGRLAAAVTDDRPETRAVLVGSQVVGLALARHVVRVEPLASLPAADVVDFIAPVFQHYLVGPLGEPA